MRCPLSGSSGCFGADVIIGKPWCVHDYGKYRVYYDYDWRGNVVSTDIRWGEWNTGRMVFNKFVELDLEKIEKLVMLQ